MCSSDLSLAACGQLRNELHAAGGVQLHTNFVEIGGRPNRLNKLQRVPGVLYIQRNDQRIRSAQGSTSMGF